MCRRLGVPERDPLLEAGVSLGKGTELAAGKPLPLLKRTDRLVVSPGERPTMWSSAPAYAATGSMCLERRHSHRARSDRR